MRMNRLLLPTLGLTLVVVACGDDTASETSAASPTTAAAVTTTTQAPATTTTVATTTTTEAPTTTTVPLTPDAHPFLGVPWSDVLPEPAERALYRVDLEVIDCEFCAYELGLTGEFPTRIEYGVTWFGQEGTYDRFVFGLEGDGPGMALYLDLAEPWVIRVFGLEGWPGGNTGRGPGWVMTYVEPAVFDLSGGPGDQVLVEGDVDVVLMGVDRLLARVAVEMLDAGAEVTVGAGTFDDAVVYEVLLFGPIVNGPDYPIELSFSVGNALLQATMSSASIELLEPWE